MSPHSSATLPPAVQRSSQFIWWVRGFVAGLLLMVAVNAVSYFFRTPGVADLSQAGSRYDEALGFPCEIWRESRSDWRLFYDQRSWMINLASAALVGAALGLVGWVWSPQLNVWVAEFDDLQAAQPRFGIRFSVGTLLLVTTVAAAFLALLTQWNGTQASLWAVYLAGPGFLIVVAMIPKNLHWTMRAIVLSFLSIALIVIAIASGAAQQVAPDRVMLGIFICWTPQSTFGAVLISVGLLLARWLRPASPVSPSDRTSVEE